MKFEHFVFALFVFALVCAAIVIAWFLFSSSRARNKRVNEREKQLLKMHHDIEDAVAIFKREADKRLDALRQFVEASDKLVAEMRGLSVTAGRLEPLRGVAEDSERRTGELRMLTEESGRGAENLRGLVVASDERVEALRRMIEIADDRLEPTRLLTEALDKRVEELRGVIAEAEACAVELRGLAGAQSAPKTTPRRSPSKTKKAPEPAGGGLTSIVESILEETSEQE